jgi:hypothetical protein
MTDGADRWSATVEAEMAEIAEAIAVPPLSECPAGRQAAEEMKRHWSISSPAAWVGRQIGLRAPPKLVLFALADCADWSTWVAHPSQPWIVEFTGHNIKTVERALKELVEKGLIEDTGLRTGRTHQVTVWRLIKPPKHPQKRGSSRASKHPRKRGSCDEPNTPKKGGRNLSS